MNKSDLQNKSVKKIQSFFRKRLRLKKKYEKKLANIYGKIQDIMITISNNFNIGISQQEKYKNSMTKLEKIKDDYQKFKINFDQKKISSFQNKQISNDLNENIVNFEQQLQILYWENGSLSIFDLIKYNIKDKGKIFINNTNFDKLLNFYNKVFITTKFKKYELSEKPSLIYSNQNNNQCNQIITFKGDSKDNDELINDIKNIENIYNNQINKPVCKTGDKEKKSLIEIIQGAIIYLPYFKEKIVYVFYGFFKDDPLNITRIGGNFGKKNKNIQNKIDNISHKNKNFLKGYINQISVMKFITLTADELIKESVQSYKEMLKLKQKTISSLVKEFLSSNVERQRYILTLFLLPCQNVDTQYLAYLMYDMISNESYLLKPQPLAEQVYNSLHWSVQKLFKIALNMVNNSTNNLLDFNENDIPYEKRILLMKAEEYIKSKAMVKLKEINQKSSDGSTKAQQYLDGLLKVPFGIYKKEQILSSLGDYKLRLLLECENIRNIQSKNVQDIKIINYCKEFLKKSEIDGYIIDIFIKKCSNIYQSNAININHENINNYFSKNKLKKDYLEIQHRIYKNLDIPINKKSETKKEIKTKILNVIHQNCVSKNIKNLQKIENIFLEKEGSPFINTNSEKTENLTKINNILNSLEHDWKEYCQRKSEYMENSRNFLDKAVYGHEEPKKQIERIIAQWINGNISGYCFGFEGPPGTGKTSLAKKGLTKCLQDDEGNSRPFSFIAIGGSSNGSTLEGHSYTYVGSTWGKIVDVLMENKCMNPIIFIDELDKVSHTEHGKEIIGILTHMTDPSQNDEFSDRYFSGIKIDLSKALIIFSYNDPSLIDPILLDRIHRVQFKALKKKEKIEIAKNYMLPEIFKTVGFSKDNIVLEDKIIEYIIDNYTYEAGVRKLKEKMFEIIREINLRWHLSNNSNKDIDFPFHVNEDFISKDIFSDKPKLQIKVIAPEPRIGLVNGLYATTVGLGGLTIIESYKIPSSSKLSLELTGKQGDVMKESMKVAKTVAWNILPNSIKNKIKNEWEISGPFGIHIHCPEGSTPKDGPSAGGAIATAIISLLTNIPIKNTIAMTGEIDLNGSIHAIGGLEAKINGAKRAGVKLVLCPKQNKNDLDKIRNDKESCLHPDKKEDFEVCMVENIWDILNIVLCDHNIDFVNYIHKSKEQDKQVSILDGTKSFKEINNIKSFLWKQLSGPNTSIIKRPNSYKTPVNNLIKGEYLFELTLCNNDNIEMKSQTKITINSLPIANAGKRIITSENEIELNGSNSYDKQNLLLTYKWNQVKGPNNSHIQNDKEKITKVSNLIIGQYEFKLTVTNQENISASNKIKVIVTQKNIPNAGEDQVVFI